MKLVLQENNSHILRFDRGENALQGILDFCKSQNIHSAWFSCIGAVSAVLLSMYDPESKTYIDHHIKEDLEVTNITGNVSMLNSELAIHAHGTFSAKDLKALGGHIKSLSVSATMEVMLNKFEAPLTRLQNPEIGINSLA